MHAFVNGKGACDGECLATSWEVTQVRLCRIDMSWTAAIGCIVTDFREYVGACAVAEWRPLKSSVCTPCTGRAYDLYDSATETD
jgi:hypothetical protein